jgi:peptidyl-prolyl cis-trans isomerase SurA
MTHIRTPRPGLRVARVGAARAQRTGVRLLGVVVVGLVSTVRLAGPAEARVVEKVAAVVGTDIILASEVEEKAGPLMADVSRIPEAEKRAARASALRREVLDHLIDDELISAQAAELRLTVTPEQVDASIAEIKRQNNIDDEQLKQALRGQGMTMAGYRSDLKKQLLRFRVLNIAVGSKINVSDEDVRAYYERHYKAGSANVQVRASHIFLSIPEGADAGAIADKEALGRKLVERAATEDFAKLAKEYSDDAATRGEGGDLGFFGKDMLPKPIEDLVFAMKLGEVRGPVRAERGFHVIKLLDRKVAEAKPLAEVDEEIRMQLRQKEMEKQTKGYLADLRKRTLVDIRY